jgi:hypothetical protein
MPEICRLVLATAASLPVIQPADSQVKVKVRQKFTTAILWRRT